MKAHVSEKKKKEVESLKNLINQYNIIGLVDLTNLPSPQFQKIRAVLKDKLFIKVSKKRLIKLAIKDLEKKGIKELENSLKGMPALIFTKEDPFSLWKILNKNKSASPAKPGQEAQKDLVISAGPTSFTPGPIIGELGQLGIKTEVKEGKVVVISDSVVAKEGEIITPEVADLLMRFGIEPMEIGLNLTTVYENGKIIPGKLLVIDEEEYKNNIKLAHTNAFNLALAIDYPIKDVLLILVKKAFIEAKSLAESQNINISEKSEESKEETKEDKKEEVDSEPESEERPVEKKSKKSSNSKETEQISEIKEESKKQENKNKEDLIKKEEKTVYFKKEKQISAEELLKEVKKEDIKEKKEIDEVAELTKNVISGNARKTLKKQQPTNKGYKKVDIQDLIGK